jgi:ABC-2 type transport system permease protein
MPHPVGPLQAVADWNPLSAVATAGTCAVTRIRPGRMHAWPMQHPELPVLAWSVALIVVFAPQSVCLYRRKSR